VFFLLGNGHHKWRVCASVILFVCIVFAGAAKSSAQDLGALARQEQARREAQPLHPVHVYTNDDLVRPRILVREDSVDLETARRKLSPALVEQSPAAEPDAREVSLGDVARKYRAEKLAHQAPPTEVARLSGPTYVYTNDDLVRPTILTPQDEVKYQAALAKPVPVETKEPAEVTADESEPAEAPLGDIAREVFHQQERVLEVHVETPAVTSVENRTPLSPRPPRTRTLAVYRTKRPAHLSSRITMLVRIRTRRHVESQSVEMGHGGLVAITVHSGDSLWKLARQHLGQGVRWRALLQANPWIRNPYQLRIGSQIRI
jgi:hypothetical protein